MVPRGMSRLVAAVAAFGLRSPMSRKTYRFRKNCDLGASGASSVKTWWCC
jgi:hypothetical protein